ncbi:MAG: HigA family addiction module antitoxin [Anaerolineae bacterium]|nr:HigA family addiction module antitoxin [Anaerolineae bacterium]MCO5191560.1 HigA family addiction module antitoxin [Anaerolineae bacterium]MCO5192503.1 HigA family addiction module antitoxin [Anaerolineae bacterium]MCO5200015.1 HigA family addiction module antitoxin [Anaerolineae bacterium]MCO5207346.1 HigA family addiction module antitoxin [Anaerolineae bacterium]
MSNNKIPPVHPGEVLLEEFLNPLGISQYRLAKEMNVYPRKINEIVHGKRAVTADTALRLSRYFGTTAELWMNLQALYDLETTRDEIEETVAREIVPLVREPGAITLA